MIELIVNIVVVVLYIQSILSCNSNSIMMAWSHQNVVLLILYRSCLSLSVLRNLLSSEIVKVADYTSPLSKLGLLLRWLDRVMQDVEARASDLNRKLIFSFFLLFS